MSAHTPGPWIAAPAQWNEGETTVVQTLKGDVIAHIEGQAFPHAEANAHLIAAAPKLLEAIETALEWLNANPGRYGAIGELNQRKLAEALKEAIS